MLGYKHSPQALAKINKRMSSVDHPMLGKNHSSSAKAKISLATSGLNNPMYGKNHSSSTKALLSAAKNKFIFQILDSNDVVVSSFDKASLIAEFLGIFKTTVYRYLNSG